MTIKSKIRNLLNKPHADELEILENLTIDIRPPLVFVCTDEICSCYYLEDLDDDVELFESDDIEACAF